ncbi:MAG: DUF547 domain-containing protein [Cyanobacteria bacterium P01_H01_bin.15]
MPHLKPWGLLVPALFLVNGCTLISSWAGPQTIDPELRAEVADKAFNYQDYNAVLKTYVQDGFVDYQTLQQNRTQLDRFAAALAVVTNSTYESWTEAEQIAFWINAYNAFTLQSIINQQSLPKSIKNIPGVWKIQQHQVLGEGKTLEEIEHSILRKEFDEPRIHAALVCAAVSCPNLRDEPFTGERLNEQLDDQSTQFITTEDKGLTISREEGIVYLSAIFDWFGKDWLSQYRVTDKQFAGNEAERAVLAFVSDYLTPEDAEYLAEGDYKVRYLNYDWALNKQSG